MRKGQVLEIAGKRAVVQVSLPLNPKLNESNHPFLTSRFSKEPQALTTCTLIVSSQVMS